MPTPIGEPIRTACLFENGQLKPLIFSWQKRNYKILQTVFSYAKQNGKEKILYFSVSCQQGNFELSFSLEKLNWRIEKADV